MRREQKMLLRVGGCFAITFISLYFSCINVLAAKGINANEQQVISTITGTFEREGVKYKAIDSYISEVRGYLSNEDVDLTSEQSSKLVSYIHANVETAIAAGYIIPVEGAGNKDETDLTEGEPQEEMPVQEENITGNDTGNKIEVEKPNETDFETQEPEEPITEPGDIFPETESNVEEEFNLVINTETDTDLEDDLEALPENNPDTQLTDAETEASIIQSENTKSNHFNIKNLLWPGIILLGVLIITGITVYIIQMFRLRDKSNINWENQNYVDIHAHILPGVDDGAKDIKETIQMLEIAHKQGIHTIIATPHFHVKTRKTPELIAEKVKEVQERAKEIDERFRIYQGNEIFYEQGCLEAVKQKRASTMADSPYVLIEFSLDISYRSLYEGMREFVDEGYSPIIAHVERYSCLWKNKDNIPSLVQLGCYLQVNADSIKGGILNQQTWQIRKRINENQIHFIASDCHNTKSRKPQIKEGIKDLRKTTQGDVILKMTSQNPKKIIEKKYI